MSQANVAILEEVKKEMDSDWALCFQYCRYEYSEGGNEKGYRFIWRKKNGNLQPARGQARIPSIADALELISMAMNEGWGGHDCNK